MRVESEKKISRREMLLVESGEMTKLLISSNIFK